MKNNLKLTGRKDVFFLAIMAGLILIYFYKILDLHTGFYSGDHRQQHYPWAFFYAAQIKQGMLPWWTSMFGCGFPLLAEGQVGALYPLNWVMYRIFPFDFAYTYNILLHYILGGTFFYLLIRSRGLNAFASLFGTLIYLFGTAQGGYYYNIISLKTLIWFPLGLFLVFSIFEKKKYTHLFWLGLVFFMQICAGYLQYAVYSIFFMGLTCAWLACSEIRRKQPSAAFKGLAASVAALTLGVLAAFPQLGATWELARFSNRFDFPIEFAFVGSLNPLAAATLFFPHWDGFLSAEIYFGALGLLFFIHSFSKFDLPSRKYFIFGFIASVALALGGFNLAYRGLVEMTGFSSFRIPTKFIYFSGFYGAVLCAFGIDRWFGEEAAFRKRTWVIWSILSLIAGGGLIASHYFLKIFRSPILSFFKDYIEVNFTNSVIRPHSIEVYLQKLQTAYEGVVSATHPFVYENLLFLGYVLISWIIVSLSMKQQWSRMITSAVFAVLLFVNLWAFGNTSIRGNYQPREFLEPPSKIIDFLKAEKSSGRLHRVFRDIYGADALPVMPHNNLLFSQPLAGAYSPLITKLFYQSMSDLGDVNDSNMLKVYDRNKFLAASDKIDFLNIEWIISDHELSFDRYQKVAEERGFSLYHNSNVRSRAYLADSPDSRIYFYDGQNSMSFEFESDAADLLRISDVFYPGWKAKLNGESIDINRYGDIFRSVNIPGKGSWKLEMRYEPVWKKWLIPSMCLAFFLLPAPFFFRRRGEK